VITSPFFPFSFIFAPLFENRSFSKILAYLALKFSNFGHVLLSTLDTSGNYPSSTFKLSLKDSNSNLNFGHEDPSPGFSLFLFFFLLANRPSEGRGSAGDFLLESKDLQIPSSCRL
jgi:hypothetical protein